ncbi:hypothetical protein ABTC79_19715, partial [Acinetobacter baumannii]
GVWTTPIRNRHPLQLGQGLLEAFDLDFGALLANREPTCSLEARTESGAIARDRHKQGALQGRPLLQGGSD